MSAAVCKSIFRPQIFTFTAQSYALVKMSSANSFKEKVTREHARCSFYEIFFFHEFRNFPKNRPCRELYSECRISLEWRKCVTLNHISHPVAHINSLSFQMDAFNSIKKTQNNNIYLVFFLSSVLPPLNYHNI